MSWIKKSRDVEEDADARVRSAHELALAREIELYTRRALIDPTLLHGMGSAGGYGGGGGGVGMNNPGHTHGSAVGVNTTRRSKPTLREKLAMRMGWDNSANGEAGFNHVHLHQLPTKVLVLAVTKDHGHVLIEDDSVMFPSDQLVTQLRLLEQA